LHAGAGDSAHCLQISKLAYVPAVTQPRTRSKKTYASTLYHPENPDRPAAQWIGDEGYYRTGTFGGPGQLDNKPSELGGTVVKRRLRNYAADYWHAPEDTTCNKQKANIRGRAAGFAVCFAVPAVQCVA
jgi:hypothetical protein